MNPLEYINKRAESNYTDIETRARGGLEIFTRRLFGRDIADSFFEDSMFPGLGKEEIKVIQNLRTEAGINPLEVEIRNCAELARRKALNLKPIDPKFAKLLIRDSIPDPTSNLSEGLKTSYARIFGDAVRDGSFTDLIRGNPDVISLARELLAGSYFDTERFPYLIYDAKDRQKYGANLARSSEKITDPYTLQDEQIRQGYLDAGGEISNLNAGDNKIFALKAEQTALNKMEKADDSEVEAAITIGLRAINQEFLCKNDLTRSLIELKNSELPATKFQLLPNFIKLPLNQKNCVDYARLSPGEQKILITHLKNLAHQNEFGTTAKDSRNIISNIKSMSLAQLSNTNVGQEIIHANGGDSFFTRFTPPQQLKILQKAVATRAITHNQYTGSLTQIIIESNSDAASEGIKNGQKSAAIYTLMIKELEKSLGDNKYESDDMQQKFGVLQGLEKLENLAITGQNTISETLGILPSDGINITNDEFLAISNPLQRIRNFTNLSFAFAQATHPDAHIRGKGTASLENLLQIDSATVQKILTKLKSNGADNLKAKVTRLGDGTIDPIYTKRFFLSELDKIKNKSKEKFMNGLEKAKSKILPADFRSITDSIDIHNSNYFN
jgi:hypothetical protein